MIKQASMTANPNLENLKQQLESVRDRRLDYLVIAHPDQRMIGQLKDALNQQTMAVLAMPQNCWCMDDENATELFQWCIDELGIKTILLVGHSQGGTPEESIEVCMGSETSTNRIGSILDRISANQQQMKENEKHFVGQLDRLRQIPAVAKRQLRDKGLVQGLFYRAESGVFCHYEPESGKFCALIE